MRPIDEFRESVAYTSSMAFKAPLQVDPRRTTEMLEQLAEKIPQLDEFDYDDDSGRYKLARAGYSGMSQEYLFRVEPKGIHFAVGQNVEYEAWEAAHKTVLTTVVPALGITPLNVEIYDIQYVFSFNYALGNQHQFLGRTLLGDSLLGAFLADTALYGFRPLFVFQPKERLGKGIRYSFQAQADQDWSDLVDVRYKEDAKIRIAIGAGLTDWDWGIRDTLLTLIDDHRRDSIDFVEEKVANLLRSLQEAIAAQQREGQEQ